MRAAVAHGFGPAETIRTADLPDPVPGDGEALVRIAAASVNPVDTKIRARGPAIAPPAPVVLGCDLAGEVVAVGPGVDGLAVGDRVAGCAGGVRGVSGGTYATLIAADARLLARIPASVPFRVAAAVPLAGITAFEGLFDRARLVAGQTVLVQGGTGGVGHLAIQLARAAGARVHATISSQDKAGIATDLGADVCLDHRADDFEAQALAATDGRGYDVVFNASGSNDLRASFAVAARHAAVVAIVSRHQADLAPMQDKALSLHVVYMLLPMLTGVGRARHGAIVADLLAMVADGRLRPMIDPVRFDLETVAAAHTHLESGRATGKIVIDIAG
jgi:NADPH2:quinone reductase